MKLTRQELLKQKALLDNHLAWLNSKIEELKSESLEKSEAAPPVVSSPPSTGTLSETTQTIVSGDDNVTETISQQYQPTTRDTSPMMKVGCVAVVVGIGLLFLFALFVLPNWLYPD